MDYNKSLEQAPSLGHRCAPRLDNQGLEARICLRIGVNAIRRQIRASARPLYEVRNLKTHFILIIVLLFLNSCFTSMGLFRSAKTIGRNNYEFDIRWQTLSGIQALVTNFRYGITKITDIELLGIGLLSKKDTGSIFYDVGVQGSFTQQVGTINWISLGAQGFLSTFNKYGGMRIIIGKEKIYFGYEMNYVLDDDFYHEDRFFTHNLYIGQELKLTNEIFTTRKPYLDYQIGFQYNPFEKEPNYFVGIGIDLFSKR
ncbi:MAG: hypothetical protein PVI26_10255 [Chitinispirillia bacterium]|jgi:hypothetical protein